MNGWLVVGIIGIVAGIVILFMRNQKKGPFATGSVFGDDPSVFDIDVIVHGKGNTPAGMRVVAFHNPSDGTRQSADLGVQRTHEIARSVYGYTAFRGITNYVAGFFPRSSRCEQAGFLITRQVEPGTNYDGSEFDKDPRPGHIAVCAAGLFQLVDGNPAIFVVDDPQMTLDAAAYEAEHAVLWDADPAFFRDTQYHQNGGHPILPDTRAVKSLSSSRSLRAKPAEITLADGSKVCALLVK